MTSIIQRNAAEIANPFTSSDPKTDVSETGICQNVELLHFYISPGHNYFGHHGKPAGENLVEEVSELECVAERGIRGDRFFNFKESYRGQITFFADEIYRELCERLVVWNNPPAVFRRNVVTRGIDLSVLIGREFELQWIRFRGTEECKPCYWMDQAFGPGAEAALKGRGGLRAQILSDGSLRLSNAKFLAAVL